jgi:hypothetical protein
MNITDDTIIINSNGNSAGVGNSYGTITSGGVGTLPSYNITGQTYSQSYTSVQNSSASQITKSVTKTSVIFVIIKSNGETLELVTQNMITPSEILGISKFIALAGRGGSYIQWSTIISTLDIERHFVRGHDKSFYINSNTAEMFVLLHDAE